MVWLADDESFDNCQYQSGVITRETFLQEIEEEILQVKHLVLKVVIVQYVLKILYYFTSD